MYIYIYTQNLHSILIAAHVCSLSCLFIPCYGKKTESHCSVFSRVFTFISSFLSSKADHCMNTKWHRSPKMSKDCLGFPGSLRISRTFCFPFKRSRIASVVCKSAVIMTIEYVYLCNDIPEPTFIRNFSYVGSLPLPLPLGLGIPVGGCFVVHLSTNFGIQPNYRGFRSNFWNVAKFSRLLLGIF